MPRMLMRACIRLAKPESLDRFLGCYARRFSAPVTEFRDLLSILPSQWTRLDEAASPWTVRQLQFLSLLALMLMIARTYEEVTAATPKRTRKVIAPVPGKSEFQHFAAPELTNNPNCGRDGGDAETTTV